MRAFLCAVEKCLAGIFLLLLVSTPLSTITSWAQSAPVAAFSAYSFGAALNQGKIPETIVCDIYGDSLILGVVPFGVALNGLIPSFITVGLVDSVLADGARQENQSTPVDLSISRRLNLYSGGELAATYILKLVHTGLPVVYINTVNAAPVVSKEEYVDGVIKIIRTDGVVDINTTTSIKGRGNSTWSFPKKPYRLKLSSRQSVLGNPADKDWVLLANYADKTLTRTTLAFALCEDFGIEYNNRTQPVELVINGVHQGSYLLGEHVKVAKERVDIIELDSDDERDSVITGGYFLEADARLDESHWFYSDHGIPFTIKSPEEITDKQLSYISEYINNFEGVLFSDALNDRDTGYVKYIDDLSFIRWYWVNELLKNNDAVFFSSVFLYKQRGDKLKMGPLWDFDIAAGNIDFNGNDNPEGWWVRQASWFSRLFSDPAFERKAYAFWRIHREQLERTINEVINSHTAKLTLSQQINFMKWPILGTYVWPNAVVTGSYDGEVNYLKSWMRDRINWIDAQVGPPTINLISPADGGEMLPSRKVLRWSKGGSAKETLVQVSTSPDFVEDSLLVVVSTSEHTLKINLPLRSFQMYYWRAKFSGEDEAEWVSGSFTVSRPKAPDVALTLVETLPESAVIEWRTADFLTYDIEISFTEDFSGEVMLIEDWEHARYVLEQLAPGQTVYVRVKSVNQGVKSDWSEVRSLTTSLVTGFRRFGDTGFSIYPNPISNLFFIELNETDCIDSVEILDIRGARAFWTETVSGQSVVEFDSTNFAPGIYVIVLRAGARVVNECKVIKL